MHRQREPANQPDMQSHKTLATLKGLHKVSLKFIDRRLESAYQHHLSARPLEHARIALALGLVFYALFSLLDRYFVPTPDHSTAWLIRVSVLLFGMTVLLFTFHALFRRVGEALIALTGLASAVGLVGIMVHMPANAVAEYYVSLIIVVIWTYLFPGMRFIHGLWANVAIVLTFYAALWRIGYVPEHLIAGSAFFLLSASLLAGMDARARERRRRLRFERANQPPVEAHAPGTLPLHDRLTGLPNRGLLADRLDQAIVVSRRDMRKCAGFYLDLDEFSLANDTYGWDAGDEILQVIGQRLRQAMRESDSIARLEADEFFVVSRDVDSTDAAAAIAGRLLSCVEQSIPLYSGETVKLHAHLGICLFPYPDCTADDIVCRAESALESAKAGGERRYAFAGLEKSAAQRLI